MTKQELRQLYLAKRTALSEADYHLFNRSLCDIFFTSVDLSFVNVLHTFLPIPARYEPDMWLFIDRIRREFPNVRLSVPRVNNATGHLDNFFFEGIGQLRANGWGIMEPVDGVVTPPNAIDVILVPLVVADRQGHRIGYGKGYYDKLLSLCRPDCLKIGISFFPPIERIAAAEAHDQKMNSILTPDGLYRV